MKHFTKILLGCIASVVMTSGCGVSSLLQCGDDLPCDLGAQGSTTTFAGQTVESPAIANDNPLDRMDDPQYSGDPNPSGSAEISDEISQSSTGDGLTVDAHLDNAQLTDAEMTALLVNDPFLMSVFGLEDIPFLLSSYFDNLLIDSLTPSSGSLSRMTFLERLCIQQDYPEYQCRQRYGR